MLRLVSRLPRLLSTRVKPHFRRRVAQHHPHLSLNSSPCSRSLPRVCASSSSCFSSSSKPAPAAPGVAPPSASSDASPKTLPTDSPTLLSEASKRLVEHTKLLLQRISVELKPLELSTEHQTLLAESVARLEGLLLVVIAGEFNAGKSAVVNALLGDRYCPEGVLPTTSTIRVLKYGKASQDGGEVVEDDHTRSVRVPIEFLRELSIVDTPGTNAVFEGHQRITEEYIPRADLILFTTSVDQPFSASQREFLAKIHAWHKKVVLVINKMDLLQKTREGYEERQVIDFVTQNAKQVLGDTPLIFAISARNALDFKATGNPALRDERFVEFEDYIVRTLTDSQKLKYKLETALSVAQRILDKYTSSFKDQRRLLASDKRVLDRVSSDTEQFVADTRREFSFHRSKIDNVLLRMLDRGDRFLSDTVKLSNLPKLFRPDDFKQEFERRVFGKVNQELHDYVQELVEWLSERDYRHADQVFDFVKRSSGKHLEDRTNLIGSVSLRYRSDRQRLIDRLQESAKTVLDPLQRQEVTANLESNLRKAFYQTAAVETAAVGVGAGLLTMSMLDWTGITGASVLALSGLYVVPYRRAQLKDQLRKLVDEGRETLDNSLQAYVDEELKSSTVRLNESLEPFARYVQAESGKIATIAEAVDNVEKDLDTTLKQVREL